MFAKTLSMAAAAVMVLLGPEVERDCSRSLSPGSAKGNVVLVTVPAAQGTKTDVVLFVDAATEEEAPDSKVDHVFRLQTDEAVEVQMRLADVRVDWNRSTVTVRHALDRPLALTIQKPFGPTPPSTFVGFGLSHAGGRDIALPAGEPTVAQYAALAANAGSSVEECTEWDSGGEGTASCSVGCNGGCSVSCKPGYDACCKCVLPNAKCSCVTSEPG